MLLTQNNKLNNKSSCLYKKYVFRSNKSVESNKISCQIALIFIFMLITLMVIY